MPDSENERVTCPGCGKGYRWQPKLAGRDVPCKQCQTVFTVPNAPGEGLLQQSEPVEEDAGVYELDQPEPPTREPLAKPAQGGKCPSCNSPVAEHAVLCINCGFNMQEGRSMDRPAVSELSPEDRRVSEKIAKAPLRGMTLVRIGLWLTLASLALTVLSIPVEAFLSGSMLAISSLMLVGSVVLMAAGAILCLAAPKESTARPVLIVSIVFSLAAVGGYALIEFGSIPDSWTLLVDIIDIAGTACFLYFFVMLSRYLDFHQITERAEKLFGIYLAISIGQFVFLIPMIVLFLPVVCILSIAILAAAIYALVLYVLLLIDLNNALSYRIEEEKADLAYG